MTPRGSSKPAHLSDLRRNSNTHQSTMIKQSHSAIIRGGKYFSFWNHGSGITNFLETEL